MVDFVANFAKLLVTLAMIVLGCQCTAHQILSQNQPNYAELVNEMKDSSSTYSSYYQPCQDEPEKVNAKIRTNNPLWNFISRMKNMRPCRQSVTPKNPVACEGPFCPTSWKETTARQFPLFGKQFTEYMNSNENVKENRKVNEKKERTFTCLHFLGCKRW